MEIEVQTKGVQNAMAWNQSSRMSFTHNFSKETLGPFNPSHGQMKNPII